MYMTNIRCREMGREGTLKLFTEYDDFTVTSGWQLEIEKLRSTIVWPSGVSSQL